jgi:hypothetical protein
MKKKSIITWKSIPAVFFIFILIQVTAQQNGSNGQGINYEDFTNDFLAPEDQYLATLEEWQNVIDQWLEKPVCINTDEADWLMDYKLISLYQLNKLKEYRLMYGDLLSVFELAFIEGWDAQTARKIMPLVTTASNSGNRTYRGFTYHPLRQSLVIKSAFSTEKPKGYKDGDQTGETAVSPYYNGSRMRMAVRYDLEYRKKIAFGFRVEKDPGEKLLISPETKSLKMKVPDLLTGYLQFKDLGPLKTLILGNYRVNFGYGLNLSGGQSAIRSRSGMSGMSNQVKPQTSISESGYYRGVAFLASAWKLSLTGFASLRKVDGTSIVTDSLTGNVISFGSINMSGLHRTESEISNRKLISEKTAGGALSFQNSWLKTGLVALYNQFDAEMARGSQAYQVYSTSGKENLVAGFAATIWLPGLYLFNESSFSRNRGFAEMTGLQYFPVPGVLVMLTHRYFGVNYQNLNGSGFRSAGSNSAEQGIQAGMRIELPRKWLMEFSTDHSRSDWVSYNLDAPSSRKEIGFSTEKDWPKLASLAFSFRYQQEEVGDVGISGWICHPTWISRYRIRLEGRFETIGGARMKTRAECSIVGDIAPSWLIFQDIEWNFSRLKMKLWLRTCFFDAPEYEASIYAYENDVLYDFTSFLHYGKGLRGVIMARFGPLDWMDFWIRLSTVYYTNKHAGSGWDEVAGCRQNEVEMQVRLKLPAQ